MATGHMQPTMHNALILGNLHEYRNKYSAAESDVDKSFEWRH